MKNTSFLSELSVFGGEMFYIFNRRVFVMCPKQSDQGLLCSSINSTVANNSAFG